MNRALAWATWAALLCALIAGFFYIYLRALSYPPVFDDFVHVINNRAIRYLLHPRIFLESEFTRARPLPYFTFAISYYFQGMSMSGIRWWGIAIHLGNAVLVGLLFRRLFEAEEVKLSWGALFAGGVFLLHPLAVDTVSYLSARGSLLVLFFVLLGLLIFSRRVQDFKGLVCFLVCSFLAFFSRESAAALAPLLVLVLLQTKKRWIELVPFLTPLAVGALILLWIKSSYLFSAWHGYFTIQGDVDVRSSWDYFRLSLAVWPRIIEILISSRALSLDHQLFLPANWSDPYVLGGAALWSCFAFAIYFFAKKRWAFLFPICWLFLSLIPTNSIFPLLDPLAARHVYFALPAMGWLVGLAAQKLPKPALLAFAFLLIVPGAASLARIEKWKSGTSLWQDAYEKAPGKFRVAFNYTSSLLLEEGNSQKALEVMSGFFRNAQPGVIRFEEQENALQLALGAARVQAQDTGKSIENVWREVHPEHDFWSELMLLRARLEKKADSNWPSDWKKALDRVVDVPLSPRAKDSHWVRNSFFLLDGERLMREGKNEEALKRYEFVLLPFGDTHFPYWSMREVLGDLYFKVHRENEGIKQLELAALQYKVYKRFPLALQKKLYTYFMDNQDVTRATDAIGELVRVFSDDPQLRRLYADLLQKAQSRHAARQAKEAAFYEAHAVRLDDEREVLRP